MGRISPVDKGNPKGPWKARWTDGEKPDGTRNQKYKTLPNEKAAKAFLRETETRIARGIAGVDGYQTLGEYLIAWLDSKEKIRPTTRRSYETNIRVYINPTIGTVPLNQLRHADVQRLVTSLKQGGPRKALSPSSIAGVIRTLRTALNAACIRRYIEFNPAASVELPRVVAREKTIWTIDQMDAFAKYVLSDRMGALYVLALASGMRRGELAGLRWRNVDLETGVLHVVEQIVDDGREMLVSEPKSNNSIRTLPLDATTVEALKRHRAAQNAERLAIGPGYSDSGYVFTYPDGRHLRPDYIYSHFQLLSRRSDMPKIRLHDLRGSFATHLYVATGDIIATQRFLGHDSSDFTARTYVAKTIDPLRRASEALAAKRADSA